MAVPVVALACPLSELNATAERYGPHATMGDGESGGRAP
jgi:hypothetical protein